MQQVTQEEFDALTCNRCGDCCEAFYFDGPLDVAIKIGDIETDNKNYSTDELLGWGLKIEHIIEKDRRLLWYNALVPTGRTVEDRYQYSCSYFRRLTPDFGECTIHNKRPDICRNFPYSKPVDGEYFPRCSWNVEIVNIC